MPILTGGEVVQTLRQDRATAQTLIVGASASAVDDTKRRTMPAGWDHFITRPIDAIELYDTLQKLLALEWVYAGDPAAVPDAGAPATPVRPWRLPPRASLDELRDLAMLGDLFGVATRAQQLAAANPIYQPFAAQVAALTQTFEDAQLLELLS